MDEVDKAIERLKLGSDMSLRYYGKPLEWDDTDNG